mgnify:CR=1 FL=1|jgi:Predicted membrane protein
MEETNDRLKYEKPPRGSGMKAFLQFLKYTMFAASAGLIQTGVFELLDKVFRLKYWPAYLPALIASVLWNFTLNRKFTFKSANNVPIALLKVTLYYVIFTPLSTWWGAALTEDLGWNHDVVFFGTVLINFITEFIYSKYYTFKDKFIFHQTSRYVRRWSERREARISAEAAGAGANLDVEVGDEADAADGSLGESPAER